MYSPTLSGRPSAADSGDESFDVVVLGAGMAGLSAAVEAARAGAHVVVIEQAPAVGGSAWLSAGMFWTAPDLAAYRQRIPLGDISLGRRLVADYAAALADIRRTGVSVATQPQHNVMTFGVGYSFDVKEFLLSQVAELVERGAQVRLSTSVESATRRPDGSIHLELPGGSVTAPSVVFATGGFQGSDRKLAKHMGPNAAALVHRSNPNSQGTGLDLATALGADIAGDLSTFYGHLLPSPLQSFAVQNFLPYSQYYSERTVLVNLDGRRFVDEFDGDELLNQQLLRQPEARGILIFDQYVRATHATAEPFPNLGVLDRYAAGVSAGARHVEADTLEQLVAASDIFDLDTAQLAITLQNYSAAAAAGERTVDGIRLAAEARPPQTGPFYAIEVQPSITFTFGGIRIDDRGRVLQATGRPIDGLFAAGADIGGLSNYGYAGGLAPAFISGRWAGESAAAHAQPSSTTDARPELQRNGRAL
ncbi:hypothetical protein B7R54_17940 [Subtercola boreus]|uniref:FAD-dependent oxidoreductase 2 FAD binding domain-containing protein n=1 Tax=Subtercola boreus TaxID=120213 RepID=A0A3E0VN33_9MICO|nr:FAD-dependent oxidoreductase [Subtercola boreus]RFA10880.1 hypothetical protein B7R54_17940 [Subtercola boreus]TQL55537.1 succinate dehydrogenase/fumarate reductase flavoprotein subunit [Subtercola boreus]